MGKRHLTNGNCKMPYSGILGYEKLQSALSAFVQFSLRHIFAALQNLRFRLFGLQKRQLPRTLCDIWASKIEEK